MGSVNLTRRFGGRLRAVVRGSGTSQAAGLAVAALAANVLALAFTIVFARILGAGDYGSLAAVISTFLILSVPGAALQVVVARETALGRTGRDGALAATVGHWLTRLAAILLALLIVSSVLREVLSSINAVPEEWAAAAAIPTGACWLIVSVLRGVLQGLHAYRPVALSIVGEAMGRLVIGLVFVGAGLGVTGAYLGTPFAMLATAAVLVGVLRRRTGPSDHGPERRKLRSLAAETWVPMAGLTLVAVLQNIDVIVVKHQIGGDAAGSYAAGAVAAKAIVWVAIGVGFYLVPETARRIRESEATRPVLLRSLAMVAALAIPAELVFLAAPELLLRVAFGSDLTQASGALPLLGLAMALLALSYLAVQYLLALGRRSFLVPLAVCATAEPVLLLATGPHTLETFAALVLVVQAGAAAAMLYCAARAGARREAVSPVVPVAVTAAVTAAEAGGRSSDQSLLRSSRR